MTLSKLLTTTRSREKENEIKYITKGYPLTTTPVIPTILRHHAGHKIVKLNMSGHPQESVRITYAQEGLDLVKPESVEMIKRWIAEWSHHDYENFCKKFKDDFSCNIIAVSIPNRPFTIGDSIHTFKGYSNDGYRQLSESIHCTFHIRDGIEYLAGITFYPTPHGSPKLLKSNVALLDMAKQSAIYFPPTDRRTTSDFSKRKRYGRFCTTAGKHSLLDFNHEDGVPRHKDFDHEKKVYKTWLCKECLEEFYTYDGKEKIVPKKEIKALNLYTTPSGTPPKTLKKSSPAVVAPKPAAVAAKPVEKPVVAKPVKRVCSTEKLLKDFERIDIPTEDLDSDIELID